MISKSRIITLLAASLVLAACGGGGTGDGSVAGIGGTGISYGRVNGFGSILVNGRRIDDSGATVTLDDNPGSGPNGGIKQGMVVTASGTFSGNTGTATSVVYRDNLEGTVCSTSTAGGITTLRVLGQTVIQDATTIVENGPVAISSIIEVSGQPDENEAIRASFIEVKQPVPTEVEVKGRVDSVNGGAKTLTINELDVNFNTALVDNNIPGLVPAVGQFIEVKGDAADVTCGGTRDSLVATKVELEPEGAGNIESGSEAEIEGFVTSLLSATSFKIGNREVAVTGSTLYLPDDFSQVDILVGAKIEAEGNFANGVLTAEKISFRRNVKLESDVDTVNGNTFTLVGFPGIVISTNSETTGDPAVGHIEVRGIEGPNNTVLATRIEDQSGKNDAFLQGAVDSKVGAQITILGIPVNTSLIPKFENEEEQLISQSTFLDLVELGTLVKFKGTLSGSTITFDEAELED